MKNIYRELTVIMVLIGIGISILIFQGCGKDEEKKPKTLSVYVAPKSDVTTPWSLQPRRINTTGEKLNGLSGSINDVSPVVIGTITSKSNVFTFDMSGTHDPLKREITYQWVVDGKGRRDLTGNFATITLSKDADHEVSMVAIVLGGDETIHYPVAAGFNEKFEIKKVFSTTSPLDFYSTKVK